MAFKNTKSYDEVKQLVDATGKFAMLLNDGIHTSDAEMFGSKSAVLGKDLFNLMTIGAFKTGKSTLVNSIIGLKVVKTKMLACSAVVTEVTAGKDINHVTIYYRDNAQKPDVITLDRFINEYALTIEDEKEALATGHIKRFENIDHAVIESDSHFFEYGVTLIDSPGLEDKDTCTEITTRYLNKSDAVIYTLRADGLFTKTDKDYLDRTYSGKNPKNVFFVINRINLVPKDEVSEVEDSVRNHLEGIFTGEDGKFDEELYNRRVFFVNALGAYEGKLPDGDKKQYDTSGVPEFEAELERFLLSGERYIAVLQTVLALMADSYISTKKDMQIAIEARTKSLAELEKGHADSVKLLESLDKEISDLEHLFSSTKENIVSKLVVDLNDYIGEMEKHWDEYCATIENGIGFGKLLKLFLGSIAGIFSEDKKEEIQSSVLKPLANEIGALFKDKLNVWSRRVPSLVDTDMKYLNSSLNGIMDTVSIKLDDASRIFLGYNQSVEADIGKGNGFQLIIAAIQGNLNQIVYVSSGGTLNWKEFIGTMVIQMFTDFCLLILIGGPIGVIGFVVKEIWETCISAKKMNKNILHNMKDKLFTQLRDSIREGREKIYLELCKNFDPIRDTIISTIQSKRDEVTALQLHIMADRTKSETEFESEKAHLDATLTAMGDIILELNKSILGTEISYGDIPKLAAK